MRKRDAIADQTLEYLEHANFKEDARAIVEFDDEIRLETGRGITSRKEIRDHVLNRWERGKVYDVDARLQAMREIVEEENKHMSWLSTRSVERLSVDLDLTALNVHTILEDFDTTELEINCPATGLTELVLTNTHVESLEDLGNILNHDGSEEGRSIARALFGSMETGASTSILLQEAISSGSGVILRNAADICTYAKIALYEVLLEASEYIKKQLREKLSLGEKTFVQCLVKKVATRMGLKDEWYVEIPVRVSLAFLLSVGSTNWLLCVLVSIHDVEINLGAAPRVLAVVRESWPESIKAEPRVRPL